MKEMINNQAKSFSYAIKGILSVFKTEAHMRFHLVAAIYVIFFGTKFYNLGSAQWAVLILTILSVLVTEIFNTALERLCDTVTKEYSANIKFIKDISAGAVLLAAISAVAIAFVMLFRVDVFSYIAFYYSRHIISLIVLLLTAVVAVAFVAIKPENYKNYIKNLKNKTQKSSTDEKDEV